MESSHLKQTPQSISSLTAAFIFSLSASILFPSGIAAPTVGLLVNVTVPAVFVFGDSIVDPGNNNHIETIAKCNFPPYGRDFVEHRPTGRFSNGRVPSDMIAEAFGVKELLPAYLDPDLQIDDLLTGVSFASGAAGYDPQTAEFARVLSLSDQLDLYNESIATIKEEVGEERAASIVSESIYFVFTGSNDIMNTFYGPLSSLDNISSYTDLMVSSASNFIQELHGLGARRIGLMSIPPIGCVPAQRTLKGGIERNCFDDGNDAAVLFNSKLCSLADSLTSQLTGTKILYLDIFYPLLSLIENPSQYGFEVSTRGCCGTGDIEVSYLCNNLDVLTCDNDENYVFWDSFHPTEKAYRILLDQLFADNVNKFF